MNFGMSSNPYGGSTMNKLIKTNLLAILLSTSLINAMEKNDSGSDVCTFLVNGKYSCSAVPLNLTPSQKQQINTLKTKEDHVFSLWVSPEPLPNGEPLRCHNTPSNTGPGELYIVTSQKDVENPWFIDFLTFGLARFICQNEKKHQTQIVVLNEIYRNALEKVKDSFSNEQAKEVLEGSKKFLIFLEGEWDDPLLYDHLNIMQKMLQEYTSD